MPSKALIVGISGPSSSGKTTLAKYLRTIFASSSSLILHEDDFYWRDDMIPITDGLANWDCVGSVDFDTFSNCLQYIRDHGELPTHFTSKEDQNTTGPSPVDDDFIDQKKQAVIRLLPQNNTRKVVLVDGFLMYHDTRVMQLLDIKILLRANVSLLKARRESRSGYVTLAGFWQDPPDYFSKIVMPEYVKNHKHLFKNGNIEEGASADASQAGIVIADMNASMEELIDMSIGLIVDALM